MSIYSERLADLGGGVQVCTVDGFHPSTSTTPTEAFETEEGANQNGADEIDMIAVEHQALKDEHMMNVQQRDGGESFKGHFR